MPYCVLHDVAQNHWLIQFNACNVLGLESKLLQLHPHLALLSHLPLDAIGYMLLDLIRNLILQDQERKKGIYDSNK